MNRPAKAGTSSSEVHTASEEGEDSFEAGIAMGFGRGPVRDRRGGGAAGWGDGCSALGTWGPEPGSGSRTAPAGARTALAAIAWAARTTTAIISARFMGPLIEDTPFLQPPATLAHQNPTTSWAMSVNP
jgi:hypothetical protein